MLLSTWLMFLFSKLNTLMFYLALSLAIEVIFHLFAFSNLFKRTSHKIVVFVRLKHKNKWILIISWSTAKSVFPIYYFPNYYQQYGWYCFSLPGSYLYCVICSRFFYILNLPLLELLFVNTLLNFWQSRMQCLSFLLYMMVSLPPLIDSNFSGSGYQKIISEDTRN